MDDAFQILGLIESLTRYGKDLDAATATDVAELVEIYLDMLVCEIDGGLHPETDV